VNCLFGSLPQVVATCKCLLTELGVLSKKRVLSPSCSLVCCSVIGAVLVVPTGWHSKPRACPRRSLGSRLLLHWIAGDATKTAFRSMASTPHTRHILSTVEQDQLTNQALRRHLLSWVNTATNARTKTKAAPSAPVHHEVKGHTEHPQL
jgi:hypothetical protein